MPLSGTKTMLLVSFSLSIAHGKSCSSSLAVSNSMRVFCSNWHVILIPPNLVRRSHIKFRTTHPTRFAYCAIFFVLFHPGTFLGNSEAERQQMQLSLKTVSLWSHLNRPEMLRSFLNPLYEPNNRVIWPSVAPMSLVRLIF